jgi:alpha-galactosidase
MNRSLNRRCRPSRPSRAVVAGRSNAPIAHVAIAEYLAKYRKDLITPEEELLLERAASIGGSIHYFGSAKFHAQAGKAFAEAMLMMDGN